MKTSTTAPTYYDIIPDIHGHAAPLRRLLEELGYAVRDGCYSHPDRQVIFLGDFIDRGPAIRETLHLVRSMIDRGAALAVMGNHELNALGYHTPDGAGGFLRPQTAKNVHQHTETLQAFVGRDEEWREYLQWFEKLPLFLDLDTLRIVHACWNERAIEALGGSNRYDSSLLERPGTNQTHGSRPCSRCSRGLKSPCPVG